MTRATEAQARWQHEQTELTESVEALFRRARAVLPADYSHSKISRLVRGYQRQREATGRSGLEAYCLTYADPTGETAIRNIEAANR